MSAGRQQGAALILMLAILIMGAGWFVARQVESIRRDWVAAERLRNMQVLNRAKQALIGYVAAQAIKSGENNPGALPCPEPAASFNSSTGTDGKTASSCTLPAIGRFPWRTIGTEKFIDTAGEPLWYVVSPGWAYNGTNTDINSNSVGQLSVDSVSGTDSDTVVALIISPGLPMNVPASANCTAYTQARPTSGTPDIRNYFECQNAVTSTTSYVTTGPSQSFNDTIVKVTKAEIMPGIEAAIADRINREIAPVLKTMYTGTKWNASATQTAFPFAAPFGNPSTSNFQGAAATTQGLLPFSYSPTCSPAGDARCTSSTYHTWGTSTVTKTAGSGSLWGGPSCSVSGVYNTCTGYYQSSSLTARFDDPLGNMGNALRDFPLGNHTAQVWTTLWNGISWDGWVEVTSSTTLSRQFNSDGSLSFRVNNIPLRWSGGTVYGYYYITAQRPVPTDHTLLSSTDPTTGWFVRNEWYRLVYYTIASNYAPGGSLSCTTGTNCLSVTNLAPSGAQRAMLILAGRSVNGTTRPSSTLANYLDGGNATGNYVKQTVSVASRFNDRIVVIDSN